MFEWKGPTSNRIKKIRLVNEDLRDDIRYHLIKRKELVWIKSYDRLRCSICGKSFQSVLSNSKLGH